jgi:exocyst complex component 5
MEELRAEALQQQPEITGTISRAKAAALTTSPQQQISVTVVTEFVRWNEEAISRCTLLSSQVPIILLLMELYLWWFHFLVIILSVLATFQQSSTLAANVRSVFTCLLDQVSALRKKIE